MKVMESLCGTIIILIKETKEITFQLKSYAETGVHLYYHEALG